MANLARRSFVQSTAATILVLSAPIAFAQWGTAARWIFDGIGAVAAALGVTGYITKWLQDKRCKVSVDDLEGLKLQCQTVRTALDLEGVGTIPLLKAYLDKKDGPSWVRAKVALGTFFNDGNGLMAAVNVVVQKLGTDTYPGPQEDIKRLYQAVDQIRAAIGVIASLPDTPEPQTIELAESTLKMIFDLPSLARNAIEQLQMAADDRRKVSCS